MNMILKSADCCFLCNESFNNDDKSLYKVRDHDHLTGKYRGAAHCKCNINFFSNRYLPIVFHNLRGYDSHLIITEMYKLYPDKDLTIIPNNYEKFMSFKMGKLKFIDSFQFMNSSLEDLVKNLYDKDNEDKYINFPSMKQYYKDHIDLLCKKGVYPYEFIDNDEKLNYPGLPDKSEFYSKLSKSGITDEEYIHAQDVYDKLNCKSFLDYHLTYLKTDVLLLADVFENFRKTCMKYYELDPANYVTSPGLSWDAMLLKTNIKLELMSDLKVLDIMERMKRGGLCFVGSKRHVVANNKYMENYDENKESNYIMYWDANNLYGTVMTQYLPYDEIKIDNTIDINNALKTDDNNDVGYIIECDLHFPEEIHHKLKEFPPAPEILVPKDEWMSDFQLDLQKELKIKTKTKKLIPHLMDHKNYCIHYRNLKYLVELGIEITKVHNIVSFKQKDWMKSYIDFNTDKRKQAKNDFEKDFF